MNDESFWRRIKEYGLRIFSKLAIRQMTTDTTISIMLESMTADEVAGVVEDTGILRIELDAMLNDIAKAARTAVVQSAQSGYMDALREDEKPKQMYQWNVESDNPCPDCIERDGQVGSLEYWEAVGTPDMAVTICGEHCKCGLSKI
jgi:hypothetical protein